MRGTARAASLWLCCVIDWDLIIVIAISIPVHVVSCVLRVRRRRIVVDIVVAFVAVPEVVYDDSGVDVAGRLRRTTLPLAIAALERRDVCVAAMAAWMTVTEITYKFGRASRRRICARSGELGAKRGHGGAARRGIRRVLRGHRVRCAAGVALDLWAGARRRGLGTVAGRVVAAGAGAGGHWRRVAVVVVGHAVARWLCWVLGSVHGRDGGRGGCASRWGRGPGRCLLTVA